MTLSADDFSAFFQEVYGYPPFPWQGRLLRQVAPEGKWPDVLDLPTGSGKTAAIDIAVFHLALEADRGSARCAPVRIAFVVDRRLVVDDAFLRAEGLTMALRHPPGPVTARVAERLSGLAGDGPPLIARRLRGGIPRESDWARTPAQPTVLCSTVDQIGSRLLFRGYGVSDSMKPVHAGLIGADCLILLDEAHLAEPFRQTLDWVRMYKGPNWRESASAAPWGFALLTATPGEAPGDFGLDEEDRSDPVLSKRLTAAKSARLVDMAKDKDGSGDAADPSEHEPDTDEVDTRSRAAIFAARVQTALQHPFAFNGGQRFPAIGVVVNRVARARAIYTSLKKALSEEEAELILLIGPSRSVDRDEVAKKLQPIRTGADRAALDKPLILVATQCIEAGVDIDLDALITEAAPLDALRQRFGRLNRAGRAVEPYAVVIATKADVSLRTDDPVYGKAIAPTWEYLKKVAHKAPGTEGIVDFGISVFVHPNDPGFLSPRDDAPVLLPAHLDLLSQTAPIPAADPEVALYLHGCDRQPDSITVVWRADIQPGGQDDDTVRRLLTLVPPRTGEAIELPIWAVRRWLSGKGAQGFLADVASAGPENEERGGVRGGKGPVFLWRGNTEYSRWIRAGELRPGDAIIVPASYGGVDEHGWDPSCRATARDVAQNAARPFVGRSFAVRIAPGLLDETISAEALADALASAASQSWRDLRDAVQSLALPDHVRADLASLHQAKGDKRRGKTGKVEAYVDLYGEDDEKRPRGVVFVAPFGIHGEQGGALESDETTNATEDDAAGSTPGFSLSLQQHSRDVEEKAQAFARAAGLSDERVEDLKLAGWLHDVGKADPRFQAWLNWGDPLGPDLTQIEAILAKSSRPLPRATRGASGLPEHWRHEALSVRLAPLISRFTESSGRDLDLVLWLLGTHHGYGRPLYPHNDPDDAKQRAMPDVLGLPGELPRGPGPQSLAFDWNGLDWPSLFVRLKERYGVWELARMEAILRLADHRASEKRAAEAMS
jgi:CRISPR-associated endonuclease/helicase Cas3